MYYPIVFTVLIFFFLSFSSIEDIDIRGPGLNLIKKISSQSQLDWKDLSSLVLYANRNLSYQYFHSRWFTRKSISFTNFFAFYFEFFLIVNCIHFFFKDNTFLFKYSVIFYLYSIFLLSICHFFILFFLSLYIVFFFLYSLSRISVFLLFMAFHFLIHFSLPFLLFFQMIFL